MVRTSRPLVERMTLVWHDWFATSDAGVDSQRLMLNQNQLLREHALGAFPELLAEVTKDPAMLPVLNGSDNSKRSPNENYGREMLELFTLGAGRGYTESDVRENARALTGFRNDWRRGVGSVNFRYDPNAHDTGTKTIFHTPGGSRGRTRFGSPSTHPESSLVLRPASSGATSSRCLPTPRPNARSSSCTSAAVGRSSRSSLRSSSTPRSTTGPRMVKSPAVYNAGLLRRLGRGVDTTAYAWLGAMAGQRLFSPPNVAGWDDSRWLDTATWRGRWWIATYVLEAVRTRSGQGNAALRRTGARRRRAPVLEQARRSETRRTRALLTFAKAALADAKQTAWKRKQYAVMTQNALRHLIAVSPEMQAA